MARLLGMSLAGPAVDAEADRHILLKNLRNSFIRATCARQGLRVKTVR